MPRSVSRFRVDSPSCGSGSGAVCCMVGGRGGNSIVKGVTTPAMGFGGPMYRVSKYIASDRASAPVNSISMSIFSVLANVFLFGIGARSSNCCTITITNNHSCLLSVSTPERSRGCGQFFVSSVVSSDVNARDYVLSDGLSLAFSLCSGLVCGPVGTSICVASVRGHECGGVGVGGVGGGRCDVALSLNRTCHVRFSGRSCSGFRVSLSSGEPVRFGGSRLSVRLSPVIGRLEIGMVSSRSKRGITSSIVFTGDNLSRRVSVGSSGSNFIGYDLETSILCTISACDGNCLFSGRRVSVSGMGSNSRRVVTLQPVGRNIMIRLSSIGFRCGSTRVGPRSFRSLGRIITLLRGGGSIEVRLSTRASSDKDSGCGLSLSRHQTRSMLGCLVSGNVSTSHFVTVKCKGSGPLIPGSSSRGETGGHEIRFIIVWGLKKIFVGGVFSILLFMYVVIGLCTSRCSSVMHSLSGGSGSIGFCRCRLCRGRRPRVKGMCFRVKLLSCSCLLGAGPLASVCTFGRRICGSGLCFNDTLRFAGTTGLHGCSRRCTILNITGPRVARLTRFIGGGGTRVRSVGRHNVHLGRTFIGLSSGCRHYIRLFTGLGSRCRDVGVLCLLVGGRVHRSVHILGSVSSSVRLCVSRCGSTLGSFPVGKCGPGFGVLPVRLFHVSTLYSIGLVASGVIVCSFNL